MKKVEIEVLMATYNGAQYLEEQLDSILNQKDNRWHLTVSDDLSTDKTPHILSEYEAAYSQKIRRAFSGQRFGNAKDHFIWLLEQCKAPYIAFSDQDDYFYPEKIGKLIQRMQELEEEYGEHTPLLVFSDQCVTDEKGLTIAPSLMQYQKQYFSFFDYRSILLQNVVTGGAMMCNRALADLALIPKDRSKIIMHDWWLAVVAARFGKISYINAPLGIYRQHDHNSIGAKNVASFEYIKSQFRNLDKTKQAIQNKKEQASLFRDTYKEQLGPDDLSFLIDFQKKRSGFSFYFSNRKLIHGIHRFVGYTLWG